LKVLLTGGLGFIGRYVIMKLVGSNSVIVLSRNSAEKDSEHNMAAQITIEMGDVKDASRVKEVMKKYHPESVVHLAALTGIRKCNENPSLAFMTNLLGTYNVVMECVANGSKLIFVSSREVYGDTATTSTREDAPLIPNNVYGVTKMLGERLVTWASSKYNLDYTILRLTNVYGPRGDKYNIQAMTWRALTKGRIQMFGGNQIMNLVYIEDVADVIGRCLTSPRVSREIFNVGSNDNMSVKELVSKIVSQLSIPVKIEKASMRFGETLNFRPNLEKLEKTLGYRCPTDFSTGLQKTIQWYEELYRNSNGQDLMK